MVGGVCRGRDGGMVGQWLEVSVMDREGTWMVGQCRVMSGY